MKRPEVLLFLVGIPMALCSVCSMLFFTSPAVKSMMNSTASMFGIFALRMPLLLDGAIGAAIGISAYYVVRAAIDLWERWEKRSHIYPDANGDLPIMRETPGVKYIDYSPPDVRRLNAFTRISLAFGGKPPSAAALRNVIATEPQTIDAEVEVIEPEPEYTGGPALLPTDISAYDIQPSAYPELAIGQGMQTPLRLGFDQLTWLLIAGSSGGGKSNAIMAMLIHLMRSHPRGDIVQFDLIDLKRVTFTKIPSDLPIVSAPAVVDIHGAVEILESYWAEMDRRYQLMEQAGVVEIEEYNAKYPDQALPYRFLAIDEIANLKPSKRQLPEERKLAERANGLLYKILQEARAAGGRGVIATQYPNRSVVDEVIKAQCPFRITFQQPTSNNYKLVLDDQNVSLPNIKGRGLFMSNDIQPFQAYNAHLKDGGYDRFIQEMRKNGKNTGMSGNTAPNTGIYTPHTAPIPQHTAPVPPQYRTDTAPIPQRDSELRRPVSPALVRRVHQIYRTSGKRQIKPTQRLIWPELETGGDRWYWLREIIRHAEGQSPHPDCPFTVRFE